MNTILETIQSHLSFLESALVVSSRMYNTSKTGNIDAVTNEADNFERLLGVIEQIQKDIEQRIYLLDPKEVRMDQLEVLRLWVQEVNILTEKINQFDELTLECLNQVKDQTGAEIASVFANKEKIRGYGFNSVKK